MIIYCHIPQRLVWVTSRDLWRLIVLQTVRTCIAVCYPTNFSVSEAVRAEVKNMAVVIRKSPKSQVYQIGEFIHWLDIGISSAEMTKQEKHYERSPPTTSEI